MVGYLYILETEGNRYYIGSTNNIERRLFEHRLGKTKSLRYLLPIKLVFSQKYNSIRVAKKIELKLKKYKNKSIIQRIIEDKEIKMGP